MRPFRMHDRESKSLAWLQRFLTVNDRVNEYTDLGMQSGTFKILKFELSRKRKYRRFLTWILYEA